MTFAEFQATRRYCADLGKAIADARWQGEPPAKGNLYLDGTLYIEEVQAMQFMALRGEELSALYDTCPEESLAISSALGLTFRLGDCSPT